MAKIHKGGLNLTSGLNVVHTLNLALNEHDSSHVCIHKHGPIMEVQGLLISCLVESID